MPSWPCRGKHWVGPMWGRFHAKTQSAQSCGTVGARTSLEPGSASGTLMLHLLGLLHTQQGLVVGTQYQGMVDSGTQSHMGAGGVDVLPSVDLDKRSPCSVLMAQVTPTQQATFQWVPIPYLFFHVCHGSRSSEHQSSALLPPATGKCWNWEKHHCFVHHNPFFLVFQQKKDAELQEGPRGLLHISVTRCRCPCPNSAIVPSIPTMGCMCPRTSAAPSKVSTHLRAPSPGLLHALWPSAAIPSGIMHMYTALTQPCVPLGALNILDTLKHLLQVRADVSNTPWGEKGSKVLGGHQQLTEHQPGPRRSVLLAQLLLFSQHIVCSEISLRAAGYSHPGHPKHQKVMLQNALCLVRVPASLSTPVISSSCKQISAGRGLARLAARLSLLL